MCVILRVFSWDFSVTITSRGKAREFSVSSVQARLAPFFAFSMSDSLAPDLRLARIVAAWTELPESIRRAMLAIVATAVPGAPAISRKAAG